MNIKPIGTINTCFDEKFAIPRQPGLAPSSYGHINLLDEFNRDEALKGLESFSHLILTWHAHKGESKLSVRPPRLGGNKKMGVFATRSPFRPNGICTSIVKLDRIEDRIIYFSNHDILNDTPLLDIRPYIPAWDSLPNANQGWLTEDSDQYNVHFDIEVESSLQRLVTEILTHNPLPRYKSQAANYGFKLCNREIKITFDPEKGFRVTSINPANTEN